MGTTVYVNDADTGLTYMQQRYYDPVAGRLLSEDPVLTGANTGASFNRYVYANNNPYKYIDPDGRDNCEGTSSKVCIRSDTLVQSESNEQTTVATPEIVKTMVDNKGSVAVTSGDKEKMGFVVRDGSGLKVDVATDAKTGSTSTTDTASAVVPKGALAVIHGHIDGQSDGVLSPADAAPLRVGLSNGVVSVGRVGVTEIVGGRLQFRMLDGKMTQREVRAQQENLDKQQGQFEK